ncbi:MAG: endonuclease domain-containing protein [Patescibacteria group bacterium]|nr:endonuclease domain-containing protein [Patescibacteria group bacterium]
MSPSFKPLSQRLRRNQALWETKLWNILRDRDVRKLKFRRQFRIGNYIVDFCCLSQKLIIELDGGQHNAPDNQEKDPRRDAFLKQRGYKIIRVWNNDANNNLEGVMQKIIEASS